LGLGDFFGGEGRDVGARREGAAAAEEDVYS
jgi:hypothetical protein